MEQLLSIPTSDVSVVSSAAGTIVNNNNSIEEAIARRRAAAKGMTSAAVEEPSDEPIATTVGSIKMIEPTLIVLGERLRSDEQSDPELERSIRAMGQLCPILVRRSDMQLVSGSRRLRACISLGIKVLAHIADFNNVQLAEIEEDRCRLDLSPFDKYMTTEALRPFIEDQAWQRKIFGRKAISAVKKGRADDMLADHVGISRTNLRKIREICRAHEEDPTKYGEIFKSLQADRKVDRHFKAFKECQLAAAEVEIKIDNLLVHPDWQLAEVVKEGSGVEPILELAKLGLLSASANVILPTNADCLPLGLSVMKGMKCKVKASFSGKGLDDYLWLVGTPGNDTNLSGENKATFAKSDFEAIFEKLALSRATCHTVKYEISAHNQG